MGWFSKIYKPWPAQQTDTLYIESSGKIGKTSPWLTWKDLASAQLGEKWCWQFLTHIWGLQNTESYV
jgi:hypothetical protein